MIKLKKIGPTWPQTSVPYMRLAQCLLEGENVNFKQLCRSAQILSYS